jgi:hypothetical protein
MITVSVVPAEVHIDDLSLDIAHILPHVVDRVACSTS